MERCHFSYRRSLDVLSAVAADSAAVTAVSTAAESARLSGSRKPYAVINIAGSFWKIWQRTTAFGPHSALQYSSPRLPSDREVPAQREHYKGSTNSWKSRAVQKESAHGRARTLLVMIFWGTFQGQARALDSDCNVSFRNRVRDHHTDNNDAKTEAVSAAGEVVVW